MPRRRPLKFLQKLGARLRARRIKLGRTRVLVAKGVEISVTQLVLYETGQGHPPAATLHRLAMMLGTTSSALLGETRMGMYDDTAAHLEALERLYADQYIGAVVRSMEDMTDESKKSLQLIATSLKRRQEPVETVTVMR